MSDVEDHIEASRQSTIRGLEEEILYFQMQITYRQERIEQLRKESLIHNAWSNRTRLDRTGKDISESGG